jgi:hypothetical protein
MAWGAKLLDLGADEPPLCAPIGQSPQPPLRGAPDGQDGAGGVDGSRSVGRGVERTRIDMLRTTVRIRHQRRATIAPHDRYQTRGIPFEPLLFW